MSEFERKAKLFLSLIDFEDIAETPDSEIKGAADTFNEIDDALLYFVGEENRLRGWLDYIFVHSRGKAREWANTSCTTEEKRPDWD